MWTRLRYTAYDAEGELVAGTPADVGAVFGFGMLLPAIEQRIEGLVAGEITEIEQFITRSVDAAKRVEALGRPHPSFAQTVPAAERMQRADLIATANKYFTGMQQNDGKGDYPFADDCNRIENGMQTTNRPTPAGETRPDPRTAPSYSAQWSCREQFESGLLHFVTRIRDRRFVAVDPELLEGELARAHGRDRLGQLAVERVATQAAHHHRNLVLAHLTLPLSASPARRGLHSSMVTPGPARQ